MKNRKNGFVELFRSHVSPAQIAPQKQKRFSAFLLAVILAFYSVPAPIFGNDETSAVGASSRANASSRASASELMIHQVYGQGSPGTNAVSHGFIELYNPTDDDIFLGEFSLQVLNGVREGEEPAEWQVLPLAEQTIPALSSFLVVSTAWFNDNSRGENIPDEARNHRVRHVIENYDMEWDLQFSNNHISVAIVEGFEPLINEGNLIAEEEFLRVTDLVGAVNSPETIANFLGEGPAESFSRQASLRRIDFQNTRDNAADFARVDFRLRTGYDASHYQNELWEKTLPARSDDGLTDEELSEIRPRWSGDGEWAFEKFEISVRGSARRRAEIFPDTPQYAGTPVTVTVVPPHGQRFEAAESAKIPVTGAADFHLTVAKDRLSAVGTFNMPEGGGEIFVNAEFSDIRFAPYVIINQIHGQGSVGANAISHGFIELYNPTNTDVSLGNYSLQILNGVRGADGSGTLADDLGQWQVLPLFGKIIPAKSSFLVVSTDWYNDNSRIAPVPVGARNHRVRYVVKDFDMEWNVPFSNNHLSVALVRGISPLSNGNNEVKIKGTAAAQTKIFPTGTHPANTPMTVT
ncbi:MAG: lamin tail domain-containing protein, partial [Defluviitaleaceae bacterium]|nr:lamin tail domain-containing protein [Defluviitaleaceae bacterium]